jgi:hypothetical protein
MRAPASGEMRCRGRQRGGLRIGTSIRAGHLVVAGGGARAGKPRAERR